MGFENFLYLDTTTLPEVMFRLLLAGVFGFTLGYNRSKENKPLGYRVYMIVCMITCLIAVMGIEMHTKFNENNIAALDMGKIISGALTGIGFIGAGAILHKNDQVVGAVTGSCIWAAGGLGLLLGFGFYGLAVVGYIAVGFTLVFLNDVLGLFVEDKNLDKHNGKISK